MARFRAGGFTHPTYRPRMPAAAALLPYLQEIDRNGWYTNFGPLLDRFEARLAAHYGCARERVVSLANCTLGLTLTLQALEVAPGSLCALPSWTFVATAAAVRQAGLIPWFLDVEAGSWQLTPAIVEAALPGAPGSVGAALPVAPFGDATDAAAWAAFRQRHDIPVVTDAAAGFAALTATHAPAVVSLHATKPLGIGEGGFVLCETPEQAEAIRRRSNFGFDRAHRAAWTGSNAKLSEYAAAVGLAALDAWPETREAFARLADAYRAALQAGHDGFELSPPFERVLSGGVSSSCNLLLDRPQAQAVIAQLHAAGIEARQWWGEGCHAQPAYADDPRTALPVTEDLARRVVALPFHPGLSAGAVAEIVAALQNAVAQPADRPATGR